MEYIDPVTFPQRHVQLWRSPIFNLCNQIYTVAPVLLPGPPYPHGNKDSTECRQGNATNNASLDIQSKDDASLIINESKSPNEDSSCEDSLNEIVEESKSLNEDNSSPYDGSVNADTYTVVEGPTQQEEESSVIDDSISLNEDRSGTSDTSSLHKDDDSIFDVSESLKEESTPGVEKVKALNENTCTVLDNSSLLNAHNSVVELKYDNNCIDSSSVIATSLSEDDSSVIDEPLNETNNSASDIPKSLSEDNVMYQNESPDDKNDSSILNKSLIEDSMNGSSNTESNEESCYVVDSIPSNDSESKLTEDIQFLMIDQDESLNKDSKLETIHSLETFILDDGDSIPTGHVEEMVEFDFSRNIDSSCPDEPCIDATNENTRSYDDAIHTSTDDRNKSVNSSKTDATDDLKDEDRGSQMETNSINFSWDQIPSPNSGPKEEEYHIKRYTLNPQETFTNVTQIPNTLEKKIEEIQTFKSNPMIPDVTPIAMHPLMSEQVRFSRCCHTLPGNVVKRLSTPDIVDSFPRVLREDQAASLEPWSIKSSTPMLEETRSGNTNFQNDHGNKPKQTLHKCNPLERSPFHHCADCVSNPGASSDCVPNDPPPIEGPLCDEATVEATQSVLYQTAADAASMYYTPDNPAAVCTIDKPSIADDNNANHDVVQCEGIEQGDDEDDESRCGWSRSLSEKTLTELKLDSPVLSPAQQHACLLKRRQQVDAYQKRNAQPSSRYPRRHSETPGQGVNWSERLVQMTIYDENVWCGPLDDTLEL